MKVQSSFKIDLNVEFKKALQLIEQTDKNVFITGKAGTGKSTLLQYFRQKTKKQVVVLAPTGVAAVNVSGQTIHSFFGFKPDITLAAVKAGRIRPQKKKLYKELKIIIIDEISMVRADLLDCIDAFLRRHGPKVRQAFGGAQMILIGDLYQLPPVVTSRERQIFNTEYKSPYFFDAHCFDQLNIELVELQKIYRQTDQKFIELLNTIRNNSASLEELKIINQRLNPAFEPRTDDFYIHLTPFNQTAALINDQRLRQLPGRVFTFQGQMSGKFALKDLPADLELKLKIGAQAMLLNNDSRGRWINGTTGQVIGVETDEESGEAVLLIKLKNNKIAEVYPYIWELFEFKYNSAAKQIESDIIGSFRQYPVKLAWSITIHKSQGKTFEKVILDIGRGTFAHGQLYVALSRATSLEGLILKTALAKKHIWMDWRVVSFMTKYQYQISEQRCSLDDKVALIKQAIIEKAKLEIVYLKNNDSKSKRLIKPKHVGQLEYLGKTYLGMEAFCLLRQEDRVFRVDRILEIRRK